MIRRAPWLIATFTGWIALGGCERAPQNAIGGPPALDAGEHIGVDAGSQPILPEWNPVPGRDCRREGDPIDWTRGQIFDGPEDASVYFSVSDPGAHVLALPGSLPDCPKPHLPVPNDVGTSAIGLLPPNDVGIAPGEEPGDAYPAGTVYLANWADHYASIWEWDLARAVLRRRLKLPLAVGQGNMRLQRSGKVLHLLTYESNGPAYYTRIPTDLESFETSRVGRLSALDTATLVGSEKMAAVFFDGEGGPGEPGFLVATFDEKGRRTSRRRLADAGTLNSHSVLFRGHLLTLLHAANEQEQRRFLLLRLGRDLSVEGQSFVSLKGIRIDYPDFMSPTLFVSHDRLFGGDSRSPEVLELSPEGKILATLEACTPPDRRPSEPETWVGRIHVIAHSWDYVEWSDSGVERPPVPCPDIP